MPESPRIRRGENTDQFSIRSSSVLTALRAPNVRFPTLRPALLLLLLLLLLACLPAYLPCQLPYRGRRLAMKYLMQFRFTPFFFKKNSRGRISFQCSWWASNPDRKVQWLKSYPLHYSVTVLSMYNNIAHNNCSLFAHNCGDISIHQLALKGARGVAPGQPGFKNIHLGFLVFLPKVRPGTCSRAAPVLR